ncbi:MAG: hypothetical protein STHCBS139747_007379 [Sporothrix thermara]
MTAFTSRRGLPAAEKPKPESSQDSESESESDSDSDSDNADNTNQKASPRCNVPAKPSPYAGKNITTTSNYTNLFTEKASFRTAARNAIIAADNECAIEDDEDDEDNRENDDINLGDDEDLWEDEDGVSYDANGTVVIQTAVVVRQPQLQQMQQKGKTKRAEPDEGVLIVGGKVKHARHPDGSLVSNLSEQLRRAARLANSAAPTRSGSFISIVSFDGSETTREARVHGTTATHEAPFATGHPQLPNPLRCHPALVTPPRTPPEAGPQSPNLPPPAPPSTPYVVPTPPRSRFNSTTSLQDLLTPPVSPSTAVATMATAVATILTSSSGTTSTIALMAVSNASSGTSSSRTSGASSLSSTLSSAASEATPKLKPSETLPRNPILHIPQLKSPFKICTAIDANGDVQYLMPFNGYSGPRLEPTINLADQVSDGSVSTSFGIGSSGQPRPRPRPRRKLIRSASSDLLPGELTASLRQQILDENNSRYMFQHFGTRRFVDADPGATTSVAPPPLSRTESTPNVCRQPLSTVTEDADDKGKAVARGPHGFPLPTFRQVYYVDDYKEPEDWSFSRDYHSKGW